MKVFVANRVSEILDTSDAKDWSHVPGDLNPADLLTRGVSDPEKLMNNRWYKGPEFRVAAWVIHFADNCCSKEDRTLDETLSLDELKASEDLDIQNFAFKEEIRSLIDGKSLPASNRRLQRMKC